MNSLLKSHIISVIGLCPRPLLDQVCQVLRGCPAQATPRDVIALLPATSNADLARNLEALALNLGGSITWESLSCALEAAAFVLDVERQERQLELVWSGPASGLLGVRRTDQVLYDLIANAKQHITLATFAAARIQKLNSVLVEAVGRGIPVELILEFESASEGQLTKSAIAAFDDRIIHAARIYYWPLRRRERNERGFPGKLHVKCAIVDDAVLISSANLTDDALNRNMELGSLIRERATAEAMRCHFAKLVQEKVLCLLGQSATSGPVLGK